MSDKARILLVEDETPVAMMVFCCTAPHSQATSQFGRVPVFPQREPTIYDN